MVLKTNCRLILQVNRLQNEHCAICIIWTFIKISFVILIFVLYFFEGPFNTGFTVRQGGQSHGQHDWVHGFPEPVKSFTTFVILSQISCGKVQKHPYIFLHKTVSKFLLGLL